MALKRYSDAELRQHRLDKYHKDPYLGWSEERKVKHRASRRKWAAAHPKRDKNITLRYMNRHPNARPWTMLNSQAKRRGIEVGITFEFFCGLREPNRCYYCDGSLPLQGSGIDRKNSSLGYLEGNCVPCCAVHNDMKGTMDYDTFLNECRAIAEKFRR